MLSSATSRGLCAPMHVLTLCAADCLRRDSVREQMTLVAAQEGAGVEPLKKLAAEFFVGDDGDSSDDESNVEVLAARCQQALGRLSHFNKLREEASVR